MQTKRKPPTAEMMERITFQGQVIEIIKIITMVKIMVFPKSKFIYLEFTSEDF